jgi:hypothetical protein
MKKILLAASGLAFLAQTGFAQMTDNREKLLFGLKIGANLSNVYDTQDQNFHTNAKLGLAAGASLSIPLGTYFGLQPEILFSQKGFHASGAMTGNGYDFSRTLDYIDVPLFLVVKPIEAVSLMAGPQVAFLVKQTDVFTNGSTSVAQQQQFENENLRKNTFCFLLGTDINLGHVVIGLRAGWDVLNNNGDGSSSNPRYKNVWYQGTLAYRFF